MGREGQDRFESFVSFRPIFLEFVHICNHWLKMVLNSNLNFGFHFSIFWEIVDVFALCCCVATRPYVILEANVLIGSIIKILNFGKNSKFFSILSKSASLPSVCQNLGTSS